MVDDEDWAVECSELFVSSGLDGSGFLSGGFEFDEADVSAGEDEEAVGHAVGGWGYEFVGVAAGVSRGLGEGAFYSFFIHCDEYYAVLFGGILVDVEQSEQPCVEVVATKVHQGLCSAPYPLIP